MTPDSKKSSRVSIFITRAWNWIGEDSLAAASLKNILGALATAIVAWLVIGIFMIGYWTWGIGTEETTRADAVRIVLTMVAGVGGIIALTIAYRKQRGAEEGRFMASLENAARQMGALEPTVQFAGIYALASLADESGQERKQKCVDVLCGYLRLPYTATDEASTLREVVEKRTSFDTKGGVEETRTHQLRPAEKEVRLTIIRTITERLQDGAPNSWSGLNLDFRGAVFDDGDFSKAQFNGETVNFKDAQFNGGHVNFKDAQFNGETVDFSAEFNDGTVNFSNTVFNGEIVDFSADFNGGTVDFGAEFKRGRVGFFVARFNGGTVDFKDAQFNGGGVFFFSAQFDGGNVNFKDAQFNGGTVSFASAAFNDGTVDFGAKFKSGIVDFAYAGFNGGTVDFGGAAFNGGTVSFIRPSSWERPPVVPWGDGKTPEGVEPSKWPPEIFTDD